MSPMPRTNIVLIGMPGSGKSTVGVILAKQSGRAFMDTDLLIQSREGRSLQDIVDQEGYQELRRIEEEILLSLSVQDAVVATGGSAVYSRAAMEHLGKTGVIVFLDVGLAILESRVQNFGERGLAKRPDQTFAQLFAERLPLYRASAEITIPGGRLTHEEVAAAILAAYERRR